MTFGWLKDFYLLNIGKYLLFIIFQAALFRMLRRTERHTETGTKMHRKRNRAVKMWLDGHHFPYMLQKARILTQGEKSERMLTA